MNGFETVNTKPGDPPGGEMGPDHPEFTGAKAVPGLPPIPGPIGVSSTAPVPPWITSLEISAKRAGNAVFFNRLDELLAALTKEAGQRADESQELNALEEAAWLSKRIQQI